MLAVLALLASLSADGARLVGRSPWSVPAGALTQGSSEAGPRLEAAAEFSRGEAAYRRGEYTRATEHFARAHALAPHPATLFNLGMAQARSGEVVAAWHSFDGLSREAPTPEERREALAQREQLRPSVALLRVEAPPGSSVCFDTEPVMLDETPLVVTQPGEHALQVGRTALQIQLRAGETHTIDLDAHAKLERTRATSRVVVPLLATAAVGAGAGVGLGIASATASSSDARRGLGAGAAVASGIALGTVVAAIVVRVRNRPARPPSTTPVTSTCEERR